MPRSESYQYLNKYGPGSGNPPGLGVSVSNDYDQGLVNPHLRNIFAQNNVPPVLSSRSGRFYRPVPQPGLSPNLYNAQTQPFPASVSSDPYNNPYYASTSHQHGLENPFVLAILIAGLIGITLSIIIILSIWILKKGKPGQKKDKKRPSRNAKADDVEKYEAEDRNHKKLKNSHKNGLVLGPSTTTLSADVISEIKQRNDQQIKANGNIKSSSSSSPVIVTTPNTVTKPAAEPEPEPVPPSPPKRNILYKKIKNLRLASQQGSIKSGEQCRNAAVGTSIDSDTSKNVGASPAPATQNGITINTNSIQQPTRVMKETFV